MVQQEARLGKVSSGTFWQGRQGGAGLGWSRQSRVVHGSRSKVRQVGVYHGEVRLVRAVEVRLGAVWFDAARRSYAGLSGYLRVRQGEVRRGMTV